MRLSLQVIVVVVYMVAVGLISLGDLGSVAFGEVVFKTGIVGEDGAFHRDTLTVGETYTMFIYLDSTGENAAPIAGTFWEVGVPAGIDIINADIPIARSSSDDFFGDTGIQLLTIDPALNHVDSTTDANHELTDNQRRTKQPDPNQSYFNWFDRDGYLMFADFIVTDSAPTEQTLYFDITQAQVFEALPQADDQGNWLADHPWEATAPGGSEPATLLAFTVESAFLLGDVNDDGSVNGFDVDPFVDVLLNGPYNPAADMNADGSVNGFDVDPFVEAVLGGGAAPTHSLLVPEPATLTLLGLTGLALLRRRRNNE